MKKNIIVACLIIATVLTSACGNDKFVIFQPASENTNDQESTKKLTQCLEKKNIEYKIDSKGAVLIKESDSNDAVASCS